MLARFRNYYVAGSFTTWGYVDAFLSEITDTYGDLT